MKRFDFFKLSFRDDLFRVMEALQYSVSDYHALSETSSDYERNNHRYWIEQVKRNINMFTLKEIKNFQKENEEVLKDNPLLAGLLNVYVKISESSSAEEFKKIYEEFQNLQRKYPLKDNILNYIDMGCRLSLSSDDPEAVFLSYPLTLYTAYTDNGGRDDDYRGGYFYPVHKLTSQQLKEFYELDPRILDKIRARRPNMKVIEDVLKY